MTLLNNMLSNTALIPINFKSNNIPLKVKQNQNIWDVFTDYACYVRRENTCAFIYVIEKSKQLVLKVFIYHTV